MEKGWGNVSGHGKETKETWQLNSVIILDYILTVETAVKDVIEAIDGIGIWIIGYMKNYKLCISVKFPMFEKCIVM